MKGAKLKIGDHFRRVRDSNGLPSDYELKPYHMAGYTGVVRHVKRRVIIDNRGRKHGHLNVERISEDWAI